MNKDNAKDFLPLVRALADGKVIQINNGTVSSPKWDDLTQHNIMFGNYPSCYRIKPEPIELELWCHEKADNTCYIVRRNDKDTDWEREGFRKIKVREIL